MEAKLNPPLPEPATSLPSNLTALIEGLRAPQFLKGEKYQEQQWRAVRNGGHPDIIEFEKRLVVRLAKLGIPAFAHNMVRDAAHQNALYVQGVSKSKAGQSPHNYGMAVDVIHSLKAWDMTHDEWNIFGHVGREVAVQQGVKLTWGGDWRFYDPAHWELAGWRKSAGL